MTEHSACVTATPFQPQPYAHFQPQPYAHFQPHPYKHKNYAVGFSAWWKFQTFFFKSSMCDLLHFEK